MYILFVYICLQFVVEITSINKNCKHLIFFLHVYTKRKENWNLFYAFSSLFVGLKFVNNYYESSFL